MKSHHNDHNIPPAAWPPKDIILYYIHPFIRSDTIFLSQVSQYWHSLFSKPKIWEQVLIRDFGFTAERLVNIHPKNLRKIYFRLANLELNNPNFAKWFSNNIIATGNDFSILYLTEIKIDENDWDQIETLFKFSLVVSNFELANQINLVMQKINKRHDDEAIEDLTKFGNLSAVNWLKANVPNGVVTQSAYQRLYAPLSRETEISNTTSSSLLLYALQSPNLNIIKSEINKSNPQEILQACQSIVEDDENEPWALHMHGEEIATSLISPIMTIFKNAHTTLEEARSILYPIAALIGKTKIFTYLEEQFILHHINPREGTGLKFAIEPTFVAAIKTGSMEVIEWLLSRLSPDITKGFDPHYLDTAIDSKNPDIVNWFMSENVANIRIKSAKQLLELMDKLAAYEEHSIIIKKLLTQIKDESLPALNEEQIKRVLYTAAENGNIATISLLLDPEIGKIELTPADLLTLIDKALLSASIPLFEYLTSSERGKHKITLNSTILNSAIIKFSEIFNDQNNLPALIHWLTDERHGNIPVTEDDVQMARTLSWSSYMLKTLVQHILEAKMPAEQTLTLANQ